MANIKKLTLDWQETAKTVYAIIRREADGYRLNDADGAFASAPADPYVSLTEDSVIKGRYEKNESRTVWSDGEYTVAVYRQAGGSPSPVADTIIGSGVMWIISDAEVPFDGGNTMTCEWGTAQGGNANKITLRAAAPATNDMYVGQKISIIGGTGCGQTRGVLNYNGSTKDVTVARNWTVTPDTTSVYRIEFDFGPKVNTTLEVTAAGVPTNPTLQTVWTDAKAGYLDAAITSRPTLAQIEASTVLAKQAKLDFVEKWILNRLVESPSGTWTLYDTDDVTPLKVWTWTAATSTRTKAT